MKRVRSEKPNSKTGNTIKFKDTEFGVTIEVKSKDELNPLFKSIGEYYNNKYLKNE
jgi:hypothetical protein